MGLSGTMFGNANEGMEPGIGPNPLNDVIEMGQHANETKQPTTQHMNLTFFLAQITDAPRINTQDSKS